LDHFNSLSKRYVQSLYFNYWRISCFINECEMRQKNLREPTRAIYTIYVI
jgi:hypothetical protein